MQSLPEESRARNGRRLRVAFWSAVLTLLPAFVSVAQAQSIARLPDPPEKPVWQWIFTVIFAGVLGAVAFWNPKRSHQS